VNRLAVAAEGASGGVTSGTVCTAGTGAWCRNYGYDAWGNGYVPQNFGLNLDPTTPSASTNFDSNNRLNSSIWSYDAAGNQLTTGAGSFVNTYDAENRQATSAINGVTTTYTYDGDGRRVQKAAGSAVTTYVYDAGGQLAAEYGFEATQPPCTTCYLTEDHLGSTRMMTDASGAIQSLHDYVPFGEEITATVGPRVAHYYPSSALAVNDGVTQKFTGERAGCGDGERLVPQAVLRKSKRPIHVARSDGDNKAEAPRPAAVEHVCVRPGQSAAVQRSHRAVCVQWNG
jgi:YD repeat-containing protein